LAVSTKQRGRRTSSAQAAGTEAWQLLLHKIVFVRRDAMFAAAAEAGLRPQDAKAMMTLEQGPRPMGDLADSMACDPSTITAVVDRLEELGYAARQPSERDRRVKTVALTPAGQRAWQRIIGKMFEPPAGLLRLPAPDQQAFLELVRRVVAAEQ
jgi:DNA-binding MarR family transcriptional regulator